MPSSSSGLPAPPRGQPGRGGAHARFAAENRRLWDAQKLTYRHERGAKTIFDPRAQQRPEGKPYDKKKGLFGPMIALLPLDEGDEIEEFAALVRKFTKTNGPLAVGASRDEDDKPLIWYAVDTNDPIACDILLNQGAGTSAFIKFGENAKSPFEHAYSKRYDRVVDILNSYAHGELSDITDTHDSLALAAALKADLEKNDCPDCPPCPPCRCRKYVCYSRCTESKCSEDSPCCFPR